MTMIRTNIALLLLLLLTVTACATRNTIEPASEQLGAAKAALQQARVSDAESLVPALFQRAEDKIASAENAISDREATRAETLAHEAELDARLARLQADRITQQRLVDEIQAGINALQQEINAAR